VRLTFDDSPERTSIERAKEHVRQMLQILNLPDSMASEDSRRLYAEYLETWIANRKLTGGAADVARDAFWKDPLKLLQPQQKVLREFADSWEKAGYDVLQWQDMDRFQRLVRSIRFLFDWSPLDGRPGVILVHEGDDAFRAGELTASAIFLDFLLGPYWSDIGSCARCRRYFVNTSGRSEKKYCSQRCASADSATKFTLEARRIERKDKVLRIQDAIESLQRRVEQRKVNPPLNWKKWVAEKAGPEITPNLISRMLKGGELKIPQTLARRLESKRKRKEHE
jgi:hypothetical protein